jgi:hypothetical protein
MDHLAGRLAAASLSSDDPSAAAAGRGGDGNLIDVIRAVERAEGTIRDQVSPLLPPPGLPRQPVVCWNSIRDPSRLLFHALFPPV